MHKLKWIKGYGKMGMRLYQCTCGHEVLAWDLAQAKKNHDKLLNSETTAYDKK